MGVLNQTLLLDNDFELSLNSSIQEINNDYFQHEIYEEVRRNNSKTEWWHHFFAIFGTLISLLGIIGTICFLIHIVSVVYVKIFFQSGNIICIVILLRPTKSLNRLNFRRRSIGGSKDYKLISFYSYLTALSFCDLFSCVFAIINVLEYVFPFYLSMGSSAYRETWQSIRIYTHPIATTLQALSCWLICAFSIHRCKSIVHSFDCATLSQWKPVRYFHTLYMKLTAKPENNTNQTKSIYEMSIDDMPASSGACFCAIRGGVNKVRFVIILLYVTSIIYLIPQWFEKRLIFYQVQDKTYVFTAITEFGQSKIYRQLFHLWFYILAIYLLPFFLILVSNIILLKAFFESKRKCQRYKLKLDAKEIISQQQKTSPTTSRKEAVTLTSRIAEMKNYLSTQNNSARSSLVSELSIEIKQIRTARTEAEQTRLRVKSKSRALTLTLFGVVAIFFICHLPAAITKFIYVLYPKVEFESFLASLFLDFSNFLIMLNSSINFLLYIVFGPERFRREFSTLVFRVFRCFKPNAVDDESSKNSNLAINNLKRNDQAETFIPNK